MPPGIARKLVKTSAASAPFACELFCDEFFDNRESIFSAALA